MESVVSQAVDPATTGEGEPGTVVVNDAYRLIEKLGEGERSQVYRAIRIRDGAQAVVKAYRPSAGTLGLSEARVLRSIRHPSIVGIIEIGRVRSVDPPGAAAPPVGATIVVTPLVEGSPLDVFHARLPARSEAAASAVEVLAQGLAAIAHMHRRGVVHRDLHPGNLRVSGSPVLPRLTILDFDLAISRGAAAPAAGRLGFIAPEQLLGHPEARSDLYSFAASVRWALTGRDHVGGEARLPDSPRSWVPAVLRSDPIPLHAVLPDAPAALARVIDACLARDASRRPFSARAALALLDPDRADAAEAPDPAAFDPPFVGGAGPLAALASSARAALSGAAVPAVIVIEGPEASGRRRLASECAVRIAEDAVLRGSDPPAVVRISFERSKVREELARAGDALVAAAGRAGRAEVLVLVDATAPGVDVPEAVARLDGILAEARAVAGPRGAGGVAAVALVAAAPPHGGLPGTVERVSPGPLARAEVATLLGLVLLEPPADEVVDAVARASGGCPGLVLAEAAARFPDGRPAAGPAARAGILERKPVADGRLLPEEGRRLLLRLSVEPLPVPVDLLADDGSSAPGPGTLAAIPRLQRMGWIERSDEGLSLRTGMEGAAWKLATPHERLGVEKRLAAAETVDAAGVLRRACHRIRSCPAGDVGRVFEAERAAIAPADQPATARLSGWAFERDAKALGTPGLVELIRSATASGMYALARKALAAAGRTGGVPRLLAEAGLLRRTGDTAGATRILEPLVSARAGTGHRAEARAAAALDLADIALGAGDARRARAMRDAAGDPPPPSAARAAEIDARLALAEGNLAAAAAAIDAATGAGDDDAPARHRLDALRGSVLLRMGDTAAAALAFERAMAGAERRGDRHAAAVCAANLGSAALDAGRPVRAVQLLRGAALALAALGADRERPAVLLNLANALVRIGDAQGALRTLERAREIAPPDVRAGLAGYARSLEADVARRGGRLAEAIDAYRDALGRLAGGGDEQLRWSVRIDLAETMARAGDARGAIRELEALPDPPPPGPIEVRARAAALRAALADPAAVPAADLLERLTGSLATLRRPGDSWVERGALAALALAGGRAGRAPAARAAARRAEAIGRELRREVAPMGFDPLEGDPEHALVESLAGAGDHGGGPVPEPSSAGAAAGAVARDREVRRLLAIHRRLVTERKPGALLDAVLDAMIEITGAERGLLLVRRGRAGPLVPRRSRNLSATALAGRDGGSISLTIAEDVALSGEPIVTMNAQQDGRFAGSRSVHDLGLRSVMVLPLIARGRVLGVVYLDHRLRESALDPSALDVALDFAGQAAMALETARHLRLLRRRRREIERLNAELSSRVEAQEIELSGLKETLSGSLPPAGSDPFPGIVGRSDAMRAMFRRMSRLAETELPVLILGESGTGKELVARAIYAAGSRRGAPFVTENCAAIPEPLLESILFGHVRGAFTGADRDRPGLFVVADKGTLFLDEVGEMSLGLQSKLLRVLEDGEVRPVGGAAARRTDVRILAASNRDLGAMVREGAFREDLYYRLVVLTIGIPPLRERLDDLPLLVAHLLGRHAKGRKLRLTAGAMRMLGAQNWPGNVRQLENTIVRALVLADGDTIDEKCIDVGAPTGRSPGADDASGPGGALGPGDLDLRAGVEALERRLIDRALELASDNRSKAASMLGLSRFGLLKKMRRMEHPAAEAGEAARGRRGAARAGRGAAR